MNAEEYQQAAEREEAFLKAKWSEDIRIRPLCRGNDSITECASAPDNWIHLPAEPGCPAAAEHHNFDAYGYSVEYSFHLEKP